MLALLLCFLLGALVQRFFLLFPSTRSRSSRDSKPLEPHHAHGDQFQVCNKQGILWVLDPEKVPKISPSQIKGTKEHKNKKENVEVYPIKKYGKIQEHSLILSDDNDSQAVIELSGCTVVAVSASNVSSQKWSKRYPIKLENKGSSIYNGSKTCYLYLDTSWEKESWCKALHISSCSNKERLQWYANLRVEFLNYMTSVKAEYLPFRKPSVVPSSVPDVTSSASRNSSRVRLFWKRLAKKPPKSSVEGKITVVPSTLGGTKVGDASIVLNEERSIGEDGTLCWNMLLWRLFFDAKQSTEINNIMKACVQRVLSNMVTPSFIGEVTCTGLSFGNLSPYIHSTRFLSTEVTDMWAIEVDIEYSGGFMFDIETRPEVCDSEIQECIPNTNVDFLEEPQNNVIHLNIFDSPSNTGGDRNEENKLGGLKQSKGTSWKSTYMSKLKAIRHSITDHASQVPVSSSIKIASLRGTIRLHIGPPPSDQLWFGFTSMPEMDLKPEPPAGDGKIANSHIAFIISNRFKAAISENLVLPNYECIFFPWMLSEKDDWVPRKVAPLTWIGQEAVGLSQHDTSPSENKIGDNDSSKPGSSAQLDDNIETIKNEVHAQSPLNESTSESVKSQMNIVHERSPSNESTSSVTSQMKNVVHDRSPSHESSSESMTPQIKNVVHDRSPSHDSASEIVTSLMKHVVHDGSSSHESPLNSMTLVSSNQSPERSAPEELEILTPKFDEAQESQSRSTVEPRKLSPGAIVPWEVEHRSISLTQVLKLKKVGKKAKMLDLGKKMGEKFIEKTRQGKHMVDKMARK